MGSKSNFSAGYNNSYALVVGIDEYTHLSPLFTAVHGAKAIAKYLGDDLSFDVTELYNADTSRETVLRWFGELDTQPDDRVIFYFAGHGVTQSLRNRSKGFLALADSDGHWNSLGMDNILDQSDALSAKHVLFLLDACFSGLALRGRAEDFGVNRTAEYLLTRPARYAITAGGEEVVDDDGAGEYSLFTHWLLQGFHDKVLLADGILRAKGLGLFLEQNVSASRHSRALPNHGYLPGSGDGDFVFSWDTGQRFPYDFEMALTSDLTRVRWGAVGELIDLVKKDEDDLVLLARERLAELARTDPDERVRAAAQSLFDEEEAIRLEAEELIRREEADRRLEEARLQQEEAARAAREAEEILAAAQRRAEEDRLLAEQADRDRQAALEAALQSRDPMGGRTSTRKPVPVVEPEYIEEVEPEPEPALVATAPAKSGIPTWLMVGVPLIVVAVIIGIVGTSMMGGSKEPAPTELPVTTVALIPPETGDTATDIVADVPDDPTPTEVPSTTEPVYVDGDVLFEADFESGHLEWNECSTVSWTIVEGVSRGKVLQGVNLTDDWDYLCVKNLPTFTNYRLELDVNVVRYTPNASAFDTAFSVYMQVDDAIRESLPCWQYGITFYDDRIRLLTTCDNDVWTEIRNRLYVLSTNEWMSVVFESYDGEVTTYIDGHYFDRGNIEQTENSQIEITIPATPENIVLFDNLRLTELLTPFEAANPAPDWTVGEVLFEDNFESGSLANWSNEGVMELVTEDGNAVLQHSNDNESEMVHVWPNQSLLASLTNFSLELDVKIADYDSLEQVDHSIVFRSNWDQSAEDAGCYIWGLTSNSLELYFECNDELSYEITSTSYQSIGGEWFSLRLEAFEDSFRLYYDGDLVLVGEDEQRSTGELYFGLGFGDISIQYDNVRITELLPAE